MASGRSAAGRSADDRPRAEKIRQAALELFAVRGYRATTMEDIGRTAGIRGPSIYRHYGSKQQLLIEIMTATMTALITEQQLAVRSTDDVVERLRRMAEAHVRYHARHRLEAFVGNREIHNLEPEGRASVLAQRRTYERGLRAVIEAGIKEGRFHVGSARLASYAILDMGMGISAWFRVDGELAESRIVYEYGEFALKLVGAAGPPTGPAPAGVASGSSQAPEARSAVGASAPPGPSEALGAATGASEASSGTSKAMPETAGPAPAASITSGAESDGASGAFGATGAGSGSASGAGAVGPAPEEPSAPAAS